MEDDFGGEIYDDPQVSPDERRLLVVTAHPSATMISLVDTTTGA
ncbi:hypothetical protein [Sorangium sp. So ce1099]